MAILHRSKICTEELIRYLLSKWILYLLSCEGFSATFVFLELAPQSLFLSANLVRLLLLLKPHLTFFGCLELVYLLQVLFIAWLG